MRTILSSFWIAVLAIVLSIPTSHAYVDCNDIVESPTDSVLILNTSGNVGDTVDIIVMATTVETVGAFNLLIRYDSTRIQPLLANPPSPPQQIVEIYPQGRLKTLLDTSIDASFFAEISQNPADSGALAVRFNISVSHSIPLMPPGNGSIFGIPFVIVGHDTWNHATTLEYQAINEVVPYGDSTLTLDCHRSEMAVDMGGGVSASLYPTMVPGTVTTNDPSLASVSIELISGGYGTDSLQSGVPVRFAIRFTNNSGYFLTGSTNGFRLSGNGTWAPLQGFSTGALEPHYDGGVFINSFGVTGSGADTIGIGGFGLGLGPPHGFDEVVMILETTFPNGQNGIHVTIDSCWYPPGGAWLWSSTGGGIFPSWNGPISFTIYESPCRSCQPSFGQCGISLGALDHCQTVSLDLVATDPEGDPLTYNLISGPGTLVDNGGSATWSYAPSLADVGVPFPTIEVEACDAFSCSAPCDFDMAFTNVAPTVTGPAFWIVDCRGGPVYIQMVGDPVDCDPITYFIAGVAPSPIGPISIDPNSGLLTYIPDPADFTTFYFSPMNVEVGITDGNAESYFNTQITHLYCESIGVRIEKTHNTIQGGHVLVDVTYLQGSGPLGGFDFLIGYDASAISLVTAIEGSVYANCGWEYFTYRYGASGTCNGCPSGLVRIVGIAETNNGPNHPACFSMEPGDTFTSLDFLVSDNRTLECSYVPIYFYWLDCGDNALSNLFGDTIYVDQRVYTFEDQLVWDEADDVQFPESARLPGVGAPDNCINPDPNKPSAVRFIDFYNGGIDIVCADSIDARGDINLNEIAYEISDAVLFSNYFVHGLFALHINTEGQVAATDVNADGLPLTVADLVYLIRVIVGDALAVPKLSPAQINWAQNGDLLSVSEPIGAIALTVDGNSVPELLNSDIDMIYNFDGEQTRILLYSMKSGATIDGEFLRVEGEILSIEMATYDGRPVLAKQMPNTYALEQNYPNPFNPNTTIAFELAKAGEYTVEIYNVTGQTVKSFHRKASAGRVELEWDASAVASGVYYYRLTAGDYVATKKMLLLK